MTEWLTKRGPASDGPQVSVLTASLPERKALLEECMASVDAQTVQPLEQVVWVDEDREGEAVVMNRLLRLAEGDWWVWLNDDDVLEPSFLEELLPFVGEADVVYSHCRLGELDWGFHQGETFDEARLRSANYIPCTALINRAKTLELGGLREDLDHCEDWDLWLRLLDSGVKFKCVPKTLWTYRFQTAGGHVNKSIWDAGENR